MQVSFGQLYTYSEGKRVTKKQNIANVLVNRLIDESGERHGRTIVEKLERIKDADLAIIAQKDGNLKIQVQRRLVSGGVFVPYNLTKNRKLETVINLHKPQTVNTISKQVNRFFDRCIDYVCSARAK